MTESASLDSVLDRVRKWLGDGDDTSHFVRRLLCEAADMIVPNSDPRDHFPGERPLDRTKGASLLRDFVLLLGRRRPVRLAYQCCSTTVQGRHRRHQPATDDPRCYHCGARAPCPVSLDRCSLHCPGRSMGQEPRNRSDGQHFRGVHYHHHGFTVEWGYRWLSGGCPRSRHDSLDPRNLWRYPFRMV